MTREPDCDPRAAPQLAGLVAHWNDEEALAALVEAWPRDRRFELIVVDNASRRPLPRNGATIISPGRNLGFAGAINRALEETAAPVVLLLNPDARPEGDALTELIEGFNAHPEAAGLAPALVDEDGRSQHTWQLSRLPTAADLIAGLFWPRSRGVKAEPPAAAAVEQPAAAALALRRDVLETLGGLDERFHPAWFEDVDLARRLRSAGHPILYWPSACFRHSRAGSLARLGYGPFLWAYYRNMVRYIDKHHGPGWTTAARLLLPIGLGLRTLAVPFAKPAAAGNRREALRGLATATVGALTGWRRPHAVARDLEGGS